MKRVAEVAFCMVVALIFLCFGVSRVQAQAQKQAPATPPPAQAAAPQAAEKPAAPPEPSEEVKLLTQIRDLLRSRS